MPELPEVETVRRGLQAQVVGRRITKVEVGRERTVRRTSRAGGHRRAHRRHDHGGQPPRQVPAVPARHRRRRDDAPAHERPPAGGRGRHRAAAAHPRRAAPGRRAGAGAVVRRPAHVRRGGRVRPAPTSRWRCPSWPRWASTRSPTASIAQPVRRSCCAAARARSRRCCSTSTSSPASATSTATRACTSPACAGIVAPTRVTAREITRLHAAIMQVLGEAIEAGGSTLADTQYVDVDGEGGWFQLHHRVYDRAGQRCLTCGKADIVQGRRRRPRHPLLPPLPELIVPVGLCQNVRFTDPAPASTAFT